MRRETDRITERHLSDVDASGGPRSQLAELSAEIC